MIAHNSTITAAAAVALLFAIIAAAWWLLVERPSRRTDDRLGQPYIPRHSDTAPIDAVTDETDDWQEDWAPGEMTLIKEAIAAEAHSYIQWDHCDDCYREWERHDDTNARALWDLALWQVELDAWVKALHAGPEAVDQWIRRGLLSQLPWVRRS